MAANKTSPAPAVSTQARDRAAQYLVSRHRFRWTEALPWLIAAACYFVFPDRMTFGSQVLVMVMFALSLDLILGYAGIVSLGHAAFFGLGAYTVGLAGVRLGWTEPISGLFAAAVVSGLGGLISGWFLLRYRGLTLLMLTLATAIMLQEAGNLRSDITGGYDGVPGLVFDPLFDIFEYDLYGHTYYLYTLGVLVIVFYFVRRIVYSPFGQALTGIRENVLRMHAIGAPVHPRRVTVYTIAAAIAGVSGALFTQTNAYVTLTVFDFDYSAKVMVMLILGGTGRLYGAFIGAAVYMILEDHLSKLSPTFWQFGIGIILVLVVLFARRGLARTFQINQLFRGLTVLEHICMAIGERDGHTNDLWRPAGSKRAVIDEALDNLESLRLVEDALKPVRELPYGRQRLVEIAIALAQRPRVLLLDEPAAGVPSSESHLILDVVDSLDPDIAILIIEHDMDVVFRFARQITVLVQGAVFTQGTPEEISANEDVRAVYLGQEGHHAAPGGRHG